MNSQKLLTFLSLLELILAIPEMCKEGYSYDGHEVTFDRTCQRNCSQEPPRILGDTQFFNCSVGGRKDINEYNKRNPYDFNLRKSSDSSRPNFDAPKMNGVEIYFWDFDTMSLKFVFLLPPGIPGTEARAPGFLKLQRMWQPVIITYQNETDQSVTVIVEKAPSVIKVVAYRVEIRQTLDSTVVLSRKINLKDVYHSNTTIFRDLKQGCYFVAVTSSCPDVCSSIATSYGFKHLTDNCDQAHYLGPDDTLKIAAMISVCVLVVTVLIIGVCCLHKRRKHQEQSEVSDLEPRGYIIHPHIRNSSNYELVVSLKSLIKEICNCTVQDYLQMELNSHLGNSDEERIKNSLRESNFVLILCSQNVTNQPLENDDSLDSYSKVVSLAIEQRKRSNDLRILEIWFPKVRHICIPTLQNNRKYVRTVYFESEPEQLYCKIFGLRNPPGNNTAQIMRSNLQYQKIMMMCCRAQCGEEVPLLTRNSEKTIEDNSETESNTISQQERYQNTEKAQNIESALRKIEELNNSDDDDESEALMQSHHYPEHRNRVEYVTPPDSRSESRVRSIVTEADVHSSLEEGDTPVEDVYLGATATNRQVFSRCNETNDMPIPRHSFDGERLKHENKKTTCKHPTCNNTIESPHSTYVGNHNNTSSNDRKVHQNASIPGNRDVKHHLHNLQELNVSDEDIDDYIGPDELNPHLQYDYHQQHHHPHHHVHLPYIPTTSNQHDFRDEGHFMMPDQRMRSHGVEVPFIINQSGNYACGGLYSDQSRMHQPRMDHCLHGYETHMGHDSVHHSCVNSIKHDEYEMDHTKLFPRQNAQTNYPQFLPIDPNPVREKNRLHATDQTSNAKHETNVKQILNGNGLPITRSRSSKSLPSDMWSSPSDLDLEEPNSEFLTFDPIPPDDCGQSIDESTDFIDEFMKINQNSKT
ncbi:hypothetical protein ACF0H5_014866 [Mactra antiquata]